MRKNIAAILLALLVGCGVIPASKRNIREPVPGGQNHVAPPSVVSLPDPGTQTPESLDDSLLTKRLEASLEAGIADFMEKIRQRVPPGETALKRMGSLPVIAATPEEVARLTTAWNSAGAAKKVLQERFGSVDEAISEGLVFPPEGGQHNQWYQCESCQRGLETVDAHHHQCPICNKVYSGFPFDNVLYNRQHRQNITLAEDAAWAWAVTGEKKYADFAAAVLLGYADRYLEYPMISASVGDKSVDIGAEKLGRYRSAGHIQSQTLDESMMMIPAAVAFDLIYSSGSLTEQQKSHVGQNFLRAMAESINVHKTGKSNWQTWHNAALLYAGAVLGDGAMIRQALLDERNGFTSQLKVSIMPEGMWYENSWGYHYYTLGAMTHLAEGSRRLGFDLYGFPALHKMYLIAFDYLMSDGSLPRFGDAVQDSPVRHDVNEPAYAAYRDERLLSVLPGEVTWNSILLGRDVSRKSDAVPLSTRLIRGSGHAILASRGPGNLTAAMTFGPYGGFHGHFDKLSFMFFGYGEEFAVDPGRAASQAYRLPIHTHWYKASTGHNVVLVDGKGQKEAEGKCLAFNYNDDYAAVTAHAGPAFDAVSHTRFMFLAPTYLLVVDELVSNDGAVHTFDWLYHNKGESVSCTLPAGDAALGSSPEGYGYLKDISAFRPNPEQMVTLRFDGVATGLALTTAAAADDIVFTATGPFKRIEDRVPVAIVRKNGMKVRYVTVLEPFRAGQQPGITHVTVDESSDMSVTIQYGGEVDHVQFPGNRLDGFVARKGKGPQSKVLLQY